MVSPKKRAPDFISVIIFFLVVLHCLVSRVFLFILSKSWMVLLSFFTFRQVTTWNILCMYIICMFEKNEYICFGFCLFDRTIYEMREKYQHLNLLNNLDSFWHVYLMETSFIQRKSFLHSSFSSKICHDLLKWSEFFSEKINNSYNIVCIPK